ncbi:hypothetical protein T440DRAFT_258845 [Plenodomus tracheiphilus IPT5]|uniref:Uncharacterized protein n=1 Tax=Plenodomus tracheiphilus IPT5 TaxID=1408161 RepID=A0A6A7AU64_9PLEO|nr:hypothetical protein T440DRAFT_258845 [Plenodomus tracheiphilus IPT5]
MDNTALHTFLFHCPPALRSIVLLGSWDNFSRSYPLELDARRGRGIWKGCFTFSDIICDGDLDEQSTRRDGLLKMGGTYWYYYKVDEDEECHNPSEPSTTVCPLLPGQRLNVLEIPRERHSRSNSETAFTRNPGDRYLTPVPPAPLRPPPSSLRAGSDSSSSHSMSPPSPWAPRSATYPPAEQYLSPNVMRHARSASASPYIPSTPIFPDFKVLKDKLASKRSASRIRSSSKPKELEIGAPVLVSSTVDEDSLIPLSVYHPSHSRSVTPVANTKVTRSIPSIRKHFSPLASNPVDPILDGSSNISELPAEERVPLRRRSHIPSTVISSELNVNQGRIRANSADTRRTQHYLFSNDPWLVSPKLEEEEFVDTDQIVEDDTPVAPTLRRHISHLDLPEVRGRPTSSHGSDCSTSLRESPLNKDLPALPRYITPASLFACSDPFEGAAPAELKGDDTFEDLTPTSEFSLAFRSKPRSHFSTWSRDSLTSSSPTSDDDNAILSPTFSSLTSSCGNSPQRLATRYSYTSTSPPIDSKRATILYEESNDITEDPSEEDADDVQYQTPYLSPNAPQLEDLRISTFGSDIFDLETQQQPHHTDTTTTAARRQATCFGLGFQYSLPDDETTSKSTITQSEVCCEPVVAGQRGSGVSLVNELIDEFGFLGDVVV